MANVVQVEVGLDGPAITVITVTGTLDTSNVALVTIADAALLEPMDFALKSLAKGLAVSRVEFDVQDGLVVNLFFDASPTSELIHPLSGRGSFEYGAGYPRIGWRGCKLAGKTGKITMSTAGWTAGVSSFSFVLYLRKEQF